MKGSVIITFLFIGGILCGCTGVRPQDLGVSDGKLAPCPDSPNCVSTQSAYPAHALAPFTYTGTAPDAIAGLRKIVAGMKRALIMAETDTYLHIEFTSAVFRFVDDVEFVVDETEKKIHVRSASRIGYSDFGVNRRRIERIRQVWQKR